MKYIAEIDTSAYKDFKFFEDGIGKYLVCKDAGATENGGWMPLYFTECKESEERNMEILYVVTADGYDDGYGSELYLLGVFKDEESAKALEEKYSHLEVTITAVELGKEYPLSPNERGWGLTYENDNYIGGYVE